MAQFHWPIRVYYEDTDAGGIVYYANYLKFFERARTEWLRSLGIEQDTLLAQGVGFVVRHVVMDNMAAARFNQELLVVSQISTLKAASVVFEQQLYHNEKCLVGVQVKVACVQLDTMKPVAIPADILGELRRAS